jgi:hypothetical protein
MIGTNVCMYSLSGGLSVGTVLFPPFSGHIKVNVAVKYIPVIKKGRFYCSFGISSASTRILVCKSYKNEKTVQSLYRHIAEHSQGFYRL